MEEGIEGEVEVSRDSLEGIQEDELEKLSWQEQGNMEGITKDKSDRPKRISRRPVRYLDLNSSLTAIWQQL